MACVPGQLDPAAPINMLGTTFLQVTTAFALVFPGLSLATILYLTDQLEHGITTLELTGHNLVVKALTSGCGATPSWLTQDSASNRLFCLDESKTNGTISSYTIEIDGSLSRLDTVSTLPGAAHGALFGQGNGLAVAHHHFAAASSALGEKNAAAADTCLFSYLNSISSSVATYDVSKTDTHSTLELVQSETYHLSEDAIHPVGELRQSLPDFAIADPSGKFLLVPDPGADFVRIYLLNEDGRLRFTDLPPLIIAGGPRYADFLTTLDGTVYLYVTTANTNMVMGYKVLYTSSTTIEFKNVQASSISTNEHDVGGDIHISVNAKPPSCSVFCEAA
ncbi:hypothetical protein N0V82_003176 [Gnomoniopsis sp. IMI 355080]|nr:hypothetical protein N0V82_003176 [Gnomoniopsis sp. IMI 355080]